MSNSWSVPVVKREMSSTDLLPQRQTAREWEVLRWFLERLHLPGIVKRVIDRACRMAAYA